MRLFRNRIAGKKKRKAAAISSRIRGDRLVPLMQGDRGAYLWAS